MKIRRILASLLALGIMMVLAAAGTTPTLLAQGGEFDLTIAHTNDTHARLMPITAFNSDCKLQKIRAEGKNLLVLDAGDQFQGSLFYYLYKGEEAAKFLNELGFQATTFGNHEFDDGPANVARYIEMLKLPLVSANVDVSAEPT
ncbi:MAG: multifunctional 2',3'-cyclic-nucleotide 2'-phosphodiesterase/5'-nucleotidase/3'-nucleotidase, partial [Chloroflexi bacterium]